MLKRVEIKNFKSLRSTALELRQNNVLVGPNMSGKSNLLDFFKFVQDLIVPSQVSLSGLNSALNPRNGFREITWRGAEDPVIQFVLHGDTILDGEKAIWKYEIEILGNFQWGTAQLIKEDLLVTTKKDTHVLIETTNQKRNIFGTDGKQISQAPDTNRLAIDSEYPNWPGNLLRRSIVSWRFYNLLPPLMRRPNPTAATSALNIYGENLSAWLMLLQTRYSESFERLRSAAKDVFPNLEAVFTTPTAQTTVYLSSSERFLRRPITVAEMSDGELVFLAFLSLLYSPDELGGEIYFIEEPENHLHPKLMVALVDLLRQVQIERAAEGRAQVLLTTHSPFLVDKFSIDELIVLRREEGATHLQRPSDQKALRDLVNNEEIGLGDLYYSGALSLA